MTRATSVLATVGASAAPIALLGALCPAQAVLTYNIYQSGVNVVAQASGSLNLPAPTGTPQCGAAGAIISSAATICTGPNITLNSYTISGPTTFNGTVNRVGSTSVSGIATGFNGGSSILFLDSSYTAGSPIVSSATFNNTTLAGLGFTISSGTLGTWTLAGTGDTISVVLGPPATPAPGPLPLMGGVAAFAFSRHLRRRVARGSGSYPRA